MALTVGIFEDQDDAEAAIDRIVASGVESGDIHVLTRRAVDRGGQSLFVTLAQAFRDGGDVSGELVRLGLGREEAAFYDEELEDEGVLLAVESGEHRDAVLTIMEEANATFRED